MLLSLDIKECPIERRHLPKMSSLSVGVDLAPKCLLQRFWFAVFVVVAAGCGASPFRLRSSASRRPLSRAAGMTVATKVVRGADHVTFATSAHTSLNSVVIMAQ